MDRIEMLLEKLENRIPNSLAKKIDKLDDFEEKLVIAQNDFTNEPTDENKDNLKEVTDFVNDLKNDVISNLEDLVAKKVAKEKQVVTPAPAPIVEKQTNEVKPDEKPKEEKKGVSVFGIALGVVLLIGTAGAYNYFSKK
jgi:uncharacterized protein YydD (DUF2326 family)